jgi:hypothetical protein
MFYRDDRREQEEKMRREKRLPPGQALTNKFPDCHGHSLRDPLEQV